MLGSKDDLTTSDIASQPIQGALKNHTKKNY
jgi:hypothetical protein